MLNILPKVVKAEEKRLWLQSSTKPMKNIFISMWYIFWSFFAEIHPIQF